MSLLAGLKERVGRNGRTNGIVKEFEPSVMEVRPITPAQQLRQEVRGKLLTMLAGKPHVSFTIEQATLPFIYEKMESPFTVTVVGVYEDTRKDNKSTPPPPDPILPYIEIRSNGNAKVTFEAGEYVTGFREEWYIGNGKVEFGSVSLNPDDTQLLEKGKSLLEFAQAHMT